MRFLFALLLCCHIAQAQVADKYLPVKSPDKMGYPAGFFNALGTDAHKQVPSLGSFAVWRHDALIYEGYFNGQTRDSLFFVQSVTKTVVSAVAGAAQMRGLLPNLDSPVLSILPEYTRKPPVKNFWLTEHWNDVGEELHRLTLRHLLTMQAGLNYSEFDHTCNAFMFSSDPVQFTFDLDFSEEPGTLFKYGSAFAHLFSVALAHSIHADLHAFADSTLFKPAGMTLKLWPVDPQGRYVGFSNLQFTAQDLVRLGVLYLKKGKLNGKQILSEAWVKESWQAHAKLDKWDVLPGANGYGYYWWRRMSNGHQVYIASGYGGQLICVIPDLDMVVTTTCLMNNDNRGREDIRLLHLQIEKLIAASKP